MAKIIGFRRRARIPEFEEALAQLQEEATLTATFAEQMIRDGNYKAALGVIDEQRNRLALSQERMLAAFRPRFRRAHAALGGLAAVLLIGGASFAALNLRAPDAHSAEALQRAEQKIDRATASSTSDRQARQIVDAAFEDLAAIGDTAQSDPSIRRELHDLITNKVYGELLKQRPHLRAMLAAQVAELRKKVDVDVDDPNPQPSGSNAIDPSSSSAAAQPPKPDSSR